MLGKNPIVFYKLTVLKNIVSEEAEPVFYWLVLLMFDLFPHARWRPTYGSIWNQLSQSMPFIKIQFFRKIQQLELKQLKQQQIKHFDDVFVKSNFSKVSWLSIILFLVKK